jgi:hypothetical protein
MKLVPIALAAVVVAAACSSDYSTPSFRDPTPTPTPTPTAPSSRVYTSLSGKVVNEPGICIEGAKVKITKGQRAGLEVIQQTPCNHWSYGPDEGFEFTELAPDGLMTLRASARGYNSQELTVSPNSARGQAGFALTRTQ